MTGAIDADQELLLAPDLVMVAVAQLPGNVQKRFDEDELTGYTLTLEHARATSTYVGATLAGLLEEFRSPSTVADAVARYATDRSLRPDATLTGAYPAIRECLRRGYLVIPGSARSAGLQPVFAVGERGPGGRVVRRVQLLQDSEVHQIALESGGFAALKVQRDIGGERDSGRLEHEARVLRQLAGRAGAPAVLDEGSNDRRWLLLEWCEGDRLQHVIGRRSGTGPERRNDLAVRVADAYADLHDAGVVHGDVHPGNILVGVDHTIRLIDFGFAVTAANSEPAERGGVIQYYDPDHAAAVVARVPPPPASFAADQYALGAVLYEIVTGSPYLDFSLDTPSVLRQIIEDPPVGFDRRDIEPSPHLERILRTALSKDPAQRFPTVRALSDALRAATTTPATKAAPPLVRESADRFYRSVLARLRPGGDWFTDGLPDTAPTASVVYGAAGIAAALHHLAVSRADPDLLTLADQWCVRAAHDIGNPRAFTHPALTGADVSLPATSAFHGPTGVHAVQALISNASGDGFARRAALDRFVTESPSPDGNLDLTLGASGTLLAAALLWEALLDNTGPAALGGLLDLGNSVLGELGRRWDDRSAIGEDPEVTYLGIAHGWAGELLAALRWIRTTGASYPAGLTDRLDQLATLGQRDGLGARWPVGNHRTSAGLHGSMPGWCHGSAGYVHLWITAASSLDDDRWTELAERAAWHTHTHPGHIGQLCCGLAGQSYALLALFRHTGEQRWLAAARDFAARAVARSQDVVGGTNLAASLHKGHVGIAALVADLEHPEVAAMPFFGVEN